MTVIGKKITLTNPPNSEQLPLPKLEVGHTRTTDKKLPPPSPVQAKPGYPHLTLVRLWEGTQDHKNLITLEKKNQLRIGMSGNVSHLNSTEDCRDWTGLE